MSAMSELKLHQAALERENFELRASQLNNNNTISNDRRLPPVPANRIRTNSTSGSMVTSKYTMDAPRPNYAIESFDIQNICSTFFYS